MKKYELKNKAELNSIEPIVTFIEKKLDELKVERKCVVRTVLCAEEMIAAIISHSDSPDNELTIRITSALGQISIQMSCAGEAFQLDDVRSGSSIEDLDEEANEAIAALLDKIFGDHIECNNRHGRNICNIKVAASSIRSLYVTLLSIALGLICGLLMKTLFPGSVSKWISVNIFSSISTMFINALKMLMGPLVFFSIAASISDFKNIKALGKVAIKIVAFYIFTSIIAIGIGYLVFWLYPVGDSSLQSIVSNAADSYIATSETVSVSIRDTLVGIIPDNFVSPFVNGNMLQIVFISAIFGVVVSMFSGELSGCAKFLSAGNNLLGRVTGIVVKALPFAVFSSMAKMVIAMDFSAVTHVFACIPVCYLGCALMIIVYLLLLFTFSRLNPFKFIKKFGPVSLIGYSLSSSNSSMPYSMECCGTKLGISEKLYSFSIPLGATLNMDGTCISLMVVAMFLSRIYGIEVTGGMLLSLIVSIIVLSMGAPGIPGTNLICTALLLPQLGVPVEALSIVMGIHTLIGMGNAMVNITGDAAVTTVVAKSQNMIDLDIYNS